MKKYTEKIPSRDGKTDINVVVWESKQPTAVLQLIHGMSEYIDRYDDFARFLTENGFNVIGHDHLGHGYSVSDDRNYGFFADKNGDEIIIEDIHSVTELAKEKWQGLPNYILGHSMGSFCLRQYLTQYSREVYGAVIVGTGWIPAPLAKLGKKVATGVCASKGDHTVNSVLVKLTLGSNNKKFAPNRTRFDWLSRDEKQVDKYIADSLCGFDFTAGAYRDFFCILEKLGENKKLAGVRKSLPVLITSGSVDPVGGKKACEKLYAQWKKCDMEDVSLKLWENDRHEIINEIDNREIYRYILSWLKARIR